MRTTTDKTSSAGRPWIPPLRCPPFPFCCNLRFAATLFPCYCFLCCCHSVCFLSTHPALLSLLNTWLLCVLYKCNKCCAGPAKEAGFMTMPAKASKLRAGQCRAVCASAQCLPPALATTPVVWPQAHATAVWGLAGWLGRLGMLASTAGCLAAWLAGRLAAAASRQLGLESRQVWLHICQVVGARLVHVVNNLRGQRRGARAGGQGRGRWLNGQAVEWGQTGGQQP
jgi:hypothetical protein